MSGTRPKSLLKSVKGRKKKDKEYVLDDADDFLAAAVDDEDAMGKHRGGDAQKSLRFAYKALGLYTEGLAKYPRNFDLAYNKARLELEIATHPILVKALDVPVLKVLQQSLASHQYALNLNPDNAELLFNTAQVLTTIAENIAQDDNSSDNEALQHLEQALEYQGKCLRIQEVKYEESRSLQQAASKQTIDDEDDEEGAKLDSSTTSVYEDREQQEQWVSVVEPVTADTLLDTLLAQLSTLTTLCSIINSLLADHVDSAPVSLSWIESYSTKILQDMLPTIVAADTETLAPRANEITLTKVIFTSTLLELAYRSFSINVETYKAQIDLIFSSPDLDLVNTPDGLLAHSRALIAFNGAIADSLAAPDKESTDVTSHANTRWNALSKAQKLLTIAAGLTSTKSDTVALATTHNLRGDTSLLLHALSYPPISFAQATSNGAQLLKNAQVFYRNATKLFASLGDDGLEEKGLVEFRGGVVEVLVTIDNVKAESAGISQTKSAVNAMQVGGEAILRNVSRGKSDAWRQEQVQDMVDDGLVHGETFGIR